MLWRRLCCARMDGLMLVRNLRRIEPGLGILVSTGRTDDS
jgi:hypothetical protein